MKKLFMLRSCTLASAEPNTELKNTINMSDSHPSISKQVIIFKAATIQTWVANFECFNWHELLALTFMKSWCWVLEMNVMFENFIDQNQHWPCDL